MEIKFTLVTVHLEQEIAVELTNVNTVVRTRLQSGGDRQKIHCVRNYANLDFLQK